MAVRGRGTWLAALVLAIGATACGGDDGGGKDLGVTDPGTADPGVDVGLHDIQFVDSGPGDPGAGDPGAGETALPDEGPGDPGPADPGPSDPGTADPGPADVPLPDKGPDSLAPFCGNGHCEPDENCSSCTQDCGACPLFCGDGECLAAAGEDCETCPKDCGLCPPMCKDGTCQPDNLENCATCPDDCGACPPFCGDGDCSAAAQEDCATCPKDCDACPGPCGDGDCKYADGETCLTCPQDCGDCPPPCGNGVCDPNGETCLTCPQDCNACPSCGDGTCDPGETCDTCWDCGACPSVCGNGGCELDETCDNCPGDCGPCVPRCGDQMCSWPESCESCPADCSSFCEAACGDQVCDHAGGEDCASCATDCGKCPIACGNGTCEADEVCDNCPADCGECPPTVYFTRAWRIRMSGPLVAGRPMRQWYAPERCPCQQWEGGTPIWTARTWSTFDPAVEVEGLPSVAHVPDGNWVRTVGLFHHKDVPATARDAWFWSQSVGFNGCSVWDSNGGQNWWVPVFDPAAIQADPKAIGNLVFKTDGAAGLEDWGDRDPIFYFASMVQARESTWVEFTVEAPGITDRVYTDPSQAILAARTALRVVVVTDAWGSGPAGQARKALPVDFQGVSADGKSFVYRWFPGVQAWGGTLADGAYSYRFEARTAEGTGVKVLGKAGGGDRTVVLSQAPECALFPANPPAKWCP